jgi:YD repeat-containing protein
LITHVTVDGFEDTPQNRSTSKSAQSLFSGLTTYEQNEAGVRTGYQYDALGRVVRTIVAQGSPYEAVKTARYAIAQSDLQGHSSDGENAVLVEQTDVTGQRRRSWLDGAGRAVRVELEDLDHAPGVFREIARTAYDAQGRDITQTRQDWLPGIDQPLALSTLKRYDDWGNVSQIETPDGVIAHTRHDPVMRRTEQWQQSGDRLGPRTVTLSNTAGSPVQQELYDDTDRLIRTTEFIRDGLDRVIEERVKVDGQADIVTRSRFDIYSRVVERELADGTLISWTYAPHSDAEHPETVSVTPAKEAQL